MSSHCSVNIKDLPMGRGGGNPRVSGTVHSSAPSSRYHNLILPVSCCHPVDGKGVPSGGSPRGTDTVNSSEPSSAVPPATTAPAAAPVAPGYQRQTSQPKDYGNCQLIHFKPTWYHTCHMISCHVIYYFMGI